MDPTLNALAYKHRFKMSKENPPHQFLKPNRLRHHLGRLLVTVGQKLQTGYLQGQSDNAGGSDMCTEAMCNIKAR